MALLIKCDICGELYDYMENDFEMSSMQLKKGRSNAVEIKFENSHFGKFGGPQRYDLCPRCYDHMLKLIEETKKTFQGGKTND